MVLDGSCVARAGINIIAPARAVSMFAMRSQASDPIQSRLTKLRDSGAGTGALKTAITIAAT